MVGDDDRIGAAQEPESETSVSVNAAAERLEQVDDVPRAATVAAMVAAVVNPLLEAMGTVSERHVSGNAGELAADGLVAAAAMEEKDSPAGVESSAASGDENTAASVDAATPAAVEPPNTSELSPAPSATFPGGTPCKEESAAVEAVVEELGRHVSWTPMLSYTCPFVYIWCVRRSLHWRRTRSRTVLMPRA